MSRAKTKKTKLKNQKSDKNRVVSASKKMLGQLRLSSRVGQLEDQMKRLLESRSEEAKFQLNTMFGLNALVDVLESKDVITMKELDESRVQSIRAYQKAKVEEARRDETAAKYKNDPVHYDSTTDKWFVFAPNWIDTVGPFLSEIAAREALRVIQTQPSSSLEAAPESVTESDNDIHEPTQPTVSPSAEPDTVSAEGQE